MYVCLNSTKTIWTRNWKWIFFYHKPLTSHAEAPDPHIWQHLRKQTEDDFLVPLVSLVPGPEAVSTRYETEGHLAGLTLPDGLPPLFLLFTPHTGLPALGGPLRPTDRQGVVQRDRAAPRPLLHLPLRGGRNGRTTAPGPLPVLLPHLLPLRGCGKGFTARWGCGYTWLQGRACRYLRSQGKCSYTYLTGRGCGWRWPTSSLHWVSGSLHLLSGRWAKDYFLLLWLPGFWKFRERGWLQLPEVEHDRTDTNETEILEQKTMWTIESENKKLRFNWLHNSVTIIWELVTWSSSVSLWQVDLGSPIPLTSCSLVAQREGPGLAPTFWGRIDAKENLRIENNIDNVELEIGIKLTNGVNIVWNNYD